MKILKTILIALAFIPSLAFAQTMVTAGGTGLTTVPANFLLMGSTTFKLQAISTTTLYNMLNITAGSVATSTIRGMFSAVSPISYNSSTGVFTFSTSTLGLTTTDIAEGTNLYYTLTRGADAVKAGTTTIRNMLSSTATGLTYSPGIGVFSLTAGYNIPLTASTTEWSQAYASTTALTPAYIRGLFSNTATGLTYNSSTGLTSLTGGYVIPLTASSTEWTNFYNTPSTRITAGSNLSWSGNTLNATIATSSINYLRLGNGVIYTGTSTDAFGIGTSTPSSKLDIYANSGCTGMPFRVSSSSNASLFEIECNGNVGIGTTTAGFKLVTNGTEQALAFNGIASTSPAYVRGNLVYDTGNESLTFFNNEANVSLQIGQEEWIRVQNNTGSTILNGSAVYTNGSVAGIPTIALARADVASTTVVTGLATHDIANGAIGYVTTIGVVRGLNTSAFANGSTVYLSTTTAGALTTNVPVAPYYRFRVGIVASSSATLGTIHVTPSTGSLGNGTSGQVLYINPAGQQAWIATSSLGISGGSGNSAWTIGNGFIFNASSSIDNVGVGTSTPNRILHVYGNQSVGVMKVERFNAATTGSLGTQIIKGLSTGDMTDGFGPAQTFAIQDNAGVENFIASISALRAGADNTGALVLSPYTAGVGAWPGLTLNGSTKTASIGTSSAGATLWVQGDSSFPTTDLFRVSSSSNAAVMNILANGNVGIGTNTPPYKLSIAGDQSTDGNIFSGTNIVAPKMSAFGAGVHMVQFATSSNDIVGQVLTNDSSGTTAGTILNFSNNLSTKTGIGFAQRYAANLVYSGGSFNGALVGANSLPSNSLAMFTNDGSLILGVATTSAVANMDFYIGGTTFFDGMPDMRLNSSGNFSIGYGTTTAPARLSVRNSTTSSNAVFTVASSTGTSTLFTVSNDGNVGVATSTGVSKFSVIGRSLTNNFSTLSTHNSLGSTTFTVLDSGEVGINTVTPLSALEITRRSGNDMITLRSHDNSGSNYSDFTWSKSNGNINVPTNVTNGTRLGRFRMQGYANSGYNTAASFFATVVGTPVGSSVFAKIDFSTDGSGGSPTLTLGTSGVAGTPGNVGIGSSSPAYRASFVGTMGNTGLNANSGTTNPICSNVNGEWLKSTLQDCNTSDERQKHDILPLTNSYSGLDLIRGMTTWTFTMNDSGKQKIGFTAQEMVKLDPELQRFGFVNDTTGGVDIYAISAATLQGLKELDKQVQTLAGNVTIKVKSAQDLPQWIVIGLMFAWIVYREIKPKTIK